MADKPAMSEMFGGETSGGIFDIPRAPIGDTQGADMVVFGVPCATPYTTVGPYCSDAPDAVRSAFGWPGVLEHHDFDIGGPILGHPADAASGRAVDWGNLDWDPTDFAANRERVQSTVAAILDGGAVPIAIGGDDSIPIPIIAGFEDRGPLTVLQLDAHIDWRDEVGGERMGLSSNMRRASEMRSVDHMVQVGARGIGSARSQDYQDALDWGVQFFPMRAVIADGLQPVVDAIAEGASVFVSLDIDSLDPAIVPSVIGPAPGGLSYWQVVTLLEQVSERATIVGFDLAELMPSADIGGRGALVAARLIAVVMGLVARQA